jgi:hypothetical protein
LAVRQADPVSPSISLFAITGDNDPASNIWLVAKLRWGGVGRTEGISHVAAKKFRAPLGVVVDYLCAGRTAVSAMSLDGRGIAERKKAVI